MPFIEVTTGQIPELMKRELARRLTDVFVTSEVPPEWVIVVFHHIGEGDYARGGHFPYWAEESEGDRGRRDRGAAQRIGSGPGIVDITIGQLDEAAKRRIAVGVSQALSNVGVPETDIEIHFRHVTGRDVAEGGGVFPFRPSGSTW